MRKDGSRFPVLIIEAPLINAQGVQTGWMSAVLDMSEQRRVEELSRASQDRLQATARLATVGEMASLLSHELNQPLAAISSYATGSMNLLRDMARTTLPDLMVRRAAWPCAHCRAGRARGQGDPQRARLRAPARPGPRGGGAAALLDAIMPLVSLQARKLGVRVHSRTARPRLPAVLCDRTMVEQVLLNLARNAMQAMDSPGRRDAVPGLIGCAGPAARQARAGWNSPWPIRGCLAFPRRWRASCSRRFSPPRPRAWAWA
jgi:two-component system sensor histidine kinase DctS